MALDKPVQYTRHAQTKMLLRGYVGSMVELAIEDPDDTEPGDAPESVLAWRRVNGFNLYVCYIEFPGYYRIITVFEEDEAEHERV